MSRDWKPGDVAMVVNVSREERVARFTGAFGDVGERHWCFADGSTLLPHQIKGARPLVVIDPEDRAAVERLLRGYAGWKNSDDIKDYPHYVTEMQAALREFANPTPPKPEEPLGLGAVVEDALGRKWVHLRADEWASLKDADVLGWKNIKAVRVLSPGYTEGGAA